MVYCIIILIILSVWLTQLVKALIGVFDKWDMVIYLCSGVTDDYIWVSMWTRPAHSNFTGAQRLSCCLLLVLGFMFANIMFYELIPNRPQDCYQLGTVLLSWAKIIICKNDSCFNYHFQLLHTLQVTTFYILKIISFLLNEQSCNYCIVSTVIC